MTSTERMRAARAEAKRKGKCSNCKRRRRLKSKSRCRPCLDYQNDWQKDHYAERKEAKVCTNCGAPPISGEQRCAACKHSIKTTIREWVDDHRARGLCTDCKRRARKGRPTCRRHADHGTCLRKLCTVAGCGRPGHARGLCVTHDKHARAGKEPGVIRRGRPRKPAPA